jgi:AcrR family transcriptional regulator
MSTSNEESAGVVNAEVSEPDPVSSAMGDNITDRVLDATRAALIRAEGRKITLAEVAREAGVSRPTVYRRWPDVRTLTADLVTRELIGTIADIPARGPSLDDKVDRLVAVAEALRRNRLLDILWRDPSSALAPYVFVRLGRSQQAALTILRRAVTDGQHRGDVREGPPDQLAAMVLLICQSAIQSHAIVEPILADQWSVELRHAVHSYLRVQS